MNGQDVLVVGGGILGCSAALHLSERGAHVCLIDGGAVGSGTTAAGAGFVAMWAAGAFPAWGEEELEVERYGLGFYRRLAEQGADLELNESGSLWIALTEEGWNAHLKPIAEHPASSDMQVVDPAGIEHLTMGVVHARGVYGGVLDPGGVHLTTTRAAAALAERCRGNGVSVLEGVRADQLVVEAGRVAGVETSRGPIGADATVVAAGAWSRPLLRSAGYEAPMVPLVATRLITRPRGVPPQLPTLMLEELSFVWVRGDRGRLLWGCEYEVPPRYDYVERDPPAGLHSIEERQAVSETLAVGRRAGAAIPALADAGRLTVAHGLPCYTADFRALVGPVPGIDDLYLLSGDNQAGVTHAPGYGRLLAELVTNPTSRSSAAAVFAPGRFDRVDPRAIAADAAERIFQLSSAAPTGPDGQARSI